LILILIIESLSLIFVSIQSSGNIFQWFNRLQKFSIVKSSSLVKLLEIQKLQLQTSQNQSNKKIISEEL
jgi:membrane protein required for beta-lactamase induction